MIEDCPGRYPLPGSFTSCLGALGASAEVALHQSFLSQSLIAVAVLLLGSTASEMQKVNVLTVSSGYPTGAGGGEAARNTPF